MAYVLQKSPKNFEFQPLTILQLFTCGIFYFLKK